MKTKIIDYLQEHGKVQIHDLAVALQKEGAKDFRELVKTISLMERRHELKFEDDGSLSLAKKRQHPSHSRASFMPIKTALDLSV